MKEKNLKDYIDSQKDEDTAINIIVYADSDIAGDEIRSHHRSQADFNKLLGLVDTGSDESKSLVRLHNNSVRLSYEAIQQRHVVNASAMQKCNAGERSGKVRRKEPNVLHSDWEEQCDRILVHNHYDPISTPEIARRIHDHMSKTALEEDLRAVKTIQEHLYKYLKKKS